MNPTHTITYTIHDLDRVVMMLQGLIQQCNTFTFEGHLGVGKTTLIRALLRHNGVQDTITSPTFTYLNVYKNARGAHFYHFDLYRLTSEGQFLAQGFDEYLWAPNAWSFIEWPERIEHLLETIDHCRVIISYVDETTRTLRCFMRSGNQKKEDTTTL